MPEGLVPIQFVKNWNRNTNTREMNWDEIADKCAAYSLRTNNNLKQLGLDLGGQAYSFNNVGRATQVRSVVDRLSVLEGNQIVSGIGNIAIDVSDTTKVVITSADGTALTATNPGFVAINSATTSGLINQYLITANVTITLTGAHWGLDGLGDFTDRLLRIVALDTGAGVVFGIAAKGGRTTIALANTKTVASNVVNDNMILVSSVAGADNSILEIGWFKADFDDTGNPGGENYWTIQTGVGEVVIGSDLDTESVSVKLNGTRSIYNGASFDVYSDFGTTQVFHIDGANGNTSLLAGASLSTYLNAGTTVTFRVNGATGDTFIAQGGDLLMYSDAVTTLVFKVDGATGNVGFASKLFVGDTTLAGNNYLYLSAANRLSFVTAGAESFRIDAGNIVSVLNALNFSIQSGQRLFLDNGGDTYISETAANVLALRAGGNNHLAINDAQAATVIAATDKLYFDGVGNAGGNTYFQEVGADIPIGVAGGTEFFRGKSTGEILFPAVDPPTANYTNRNSGVKAWALISAAGAVLAGYNCSSVRNAAGSYTLTWTTPFSSANYSVVVTQQAAATVDSFISAVIVNASTANIFGDNHAQAPTDVIFSVIACGTQ